MAARIKKWLLDTPARVLKVNRWQTNREALIRVPIIFALVGLATYIFYRQDYLLLYFSDGLPQQFGFTLQIATPAGYEPQPAIVEAAQADVQLFNDPKAAAKGADLVVTDVWASMGQEEEQRKREQAFSSFQVNAELMSLAAPDALFMHCLPAHRDEEVTAEVIDGPQSVVWQEAENRLHAQKALLEFLCA